MSDDNLRRATVRMAEWWCVSLGHIALNKSAAEMERVIQPILTESRRDALVEVSRLIPPSEPTVSVEWLLGELERLATPTPQSPRREA